MRCTRLHTKGACSKERGRSCTSPALPHRRDVCRASVAKCSAPLRGFPHDNCDVSMLLNSRRRQRRRRCRPSTLRSRGQSRALRPVGPSAQSHALRHNLTPCGPLGRRQHGSAGLCIILDLRSRRIEPRTPRKSVGSLFHCIHNPKLPSVLVSFEHAVDC